MKLKKIIYIAALSLFVASGVSCSVRPGDIRVERIGGVERVEMSLTRGSLQLGLEVANDSPVKVELEAGEITLTDPRGAILDLALDGSVELPRRRVTAVSLPLDVRFHGGLGAIGAMARLGGDPDDVRVSGWVRVRGGALRKTHRFDELTLEEARGFIDADLLEYLF